MWFHSLLASWQSARSRGRRPQPRPARRRTRLVLEQLEDRALPSSYSAASVSALIADINAANAAGGANTITLAAPTTSPYVLTAVNNNTNGATGLPVIAANDNLTIVGNGDTIERSTGTPDFRLLAVAGVGSLTLENLTLQGGYDASGYGGGTIYNNMGTLVLNDVTVQHNTAVFAGGGLYAYGGTVTVTNATLEKNRAWYGGGLYVVNGVVSLSNDTVESNSANYGGGLCLDGGGVVGAVSLSNDTIESNKASYGGGLEVRGGTVTLSHDTVKSNTAYFSGGGLEISPLVGTTATVTLSYDTVEYNKATAWKFGGGGGLHVASYFNGATTVTLANDTVEFNSTGQYGGGLYVSGGNVTLANDTVEFNSAPATPYFGEGGGLYVQGGIVTFANDTVESNTSGTYGGGNYFGTGGRFYLDSFTVANTINNTDNSGLNGSTANIDGTYILQNP